jgi:membrane-associated protease RseP (regulator of RpoE activity)
MSRATSCYQSRSLVVVIVRQSFRGVWLNQTGLKPYLVNGNRGSRATSTTAGYNKPKREAKASKSEHKTKARITTMMPSPRKRAVVLATVFCSFMFQDTAAFDSLRTANTRASVVAPWTTTINKKPVASLPWSTTRPSKKYSFSLSLSLADQFKEGTDEGVETQEPQATSLLVKLASSAFGASSPFGALALVACVVIFHESGHYLNAKVLGVPVDEFSVGVGPKLLSFEAFGDTFSLRALLLGGYVSINQAALLTLPWLQRINILSAGVLFNFLLSFLIYTGQILVGKGLPIAVFGQGIVVCGLDKGAAAKGSLRKGDTIEAVNGKTLLTEPTSSEMEVQRAISKLIDEVQATPEGETVVFTVLNPKTSQVKNVKIKPKCTQFGKPSLGVFLIPNYVGVDTRKTDSNPLEAAAFAATHVATATKDTAIGLVTFTGDLLSGKTGSSEYSVSGPVGVIKRASEVVKTKDWDTVLKYVAAISINFGVINCFPIPPSDGFQILYTAAEAFWKQTQQ